MEKFSVIFVLTSASCHDLEGKIVISRAEGSNAVGTNVMQPRLINCVFMYISNLVVLEY